MQQITVIIEDDQLEKLEEIADNQDSSHNEVVRNVLELGFNYRESENQTEDKLEELRNEKNQVIDKLRQEKKELEDKLKQTNQRINATNEVVNYVEEERQLHREERARNRKKESAPIWRRAKWKLFGVPENLQDGEIENSD